MIDVIFDFVQKLLAYLFKQNWVYVRIRNRPYKKRFLSHPFAILVVQIKEY